ncbi:MAG: hypothetical protein ACFCU6_12535 [Balneolaceae bacterium]
MKKLTGILCIFLFAISITDEAKSQLVSDFGDGYIRFIETGQIADTVNVWGDLGRTGRYLVPRGTTITELISFGGGPTSVGIGLRGRDATFSSVKLRIHLSKFNKERGREEIKSFQIEFDDPIPFELRNYVLSNEEIVTIEIKRTPSFLDILGVLGPILGIVTTSIVIIDRL